MKNGKTTIIKPAILIQPDLIYQSLLLVLLVPENISLYRPEAMQLYPVNSAEDRHFPYYISVPSFLPYLIYYMKIHSSDFNSAPDKCRIYKMLYLLANISINNRNIRKMNCRLPVYCILFRFQQPACK